MKLNTRTTLIAGAIAALLAGPTLAGSYSAKDSAQTSAPTKTEIGYPLLNQPQSAQPMNESPQVGAAAQTSAPTKTGIGYPLLNQPQSAQPMSETPRMGEAAQTPAPTKAGIGYPLINQPQSAQPMSETPRMGEAAQTPATTKAGIGQSEVDSQIATQPMSETPRMGAAQTPAPTKAGIGQPEVDSQIAAQPTSETPRMGAAGYGGATPTTSIGDNPLYMRSGKDLAGLDVVDSTGDKVGEVIRILLGPDRKSAHALISVGRIHGMGARDVMVSLDELKPMNDKLQMSATKAEIDLLKGETPDPDKYVEVKGNTSISGSIVEFSAFESGKEAGQPGATSTTPKGDSVKPATTPETPEVNQ